MAVWDVSSGGPLSEQGGGGSRQEDLSDVRDIGLHQAYQDVCLGEKLRKVPVWFVLVLIIGELMLLLLLFSLTQTRGELVGKLIHNEDDITGC